MCYIKSYSKLHVICYDCVSSGGGRTLPDGSTTYVLKYLCNSFNFIDIWSQTFDKTTVYI